MNISKVFTNDVTRLNTAVEMKNYSWIKWLNNSIILPPKLAMVVMDGPIGNL